MPGRADYECKTCEATIEDLPVDSIACPRCGRKRGFRRLYNKIQVNTRRPRPARILEGKRDAMRYIDEQMTPAMDAHAARKDSAKRFEGAVAEARDRIYEQATPEQRAEIKAHEGPNGMRAHRNIPAAAAFGAIDPLARHDSATYTYPALKRRVAPIWQK